MQAFVEKHYFGRGRRHGYAGRNVRSRGGRFDPLSVREQERDDLGVAVLGSGEVDRAFV